MFLGHNALPLPCLPVEIRSLCLAAETVEGWAEKTVRGSVGETTVNSVGKTSCRQMRTSEVDVEQKLAEVLGFKGDGNPS